VLRWYVHPCTHNVTWYVFPCTVCRWAGLTDTHAGMPMGITAENLAAKYGITRCVCI
jgi:hypothetical protein